MKVLCINNNFREKLITIDKWYDTTPGTTEEEYLIIDDNGDKHYVSKYRFKTIDVVRGEKLNKLGI